MYASATLQNKASGKLHLKKDKLPTTFSTPDQKLHGWIVGLSFHLSIVALLRCVAFFIR
jgi:hypothetical protein